MRFLASFSLLLAASLAAKGNTIVAYVEAPGSQASSLGSTTTETFGSFSPGIYSSPLVSAIGTYQGSTAEPFSLVAANQYGGAGKTGNFFAVGVESGSKGPIRLDLNSEVNYFGFWWSAGDPNNSVTFLENGVVYATFTTGNLVNLLPNTPSGMVTAISGSTYLTKSYYGNPNGNGDANEAFAYVDVIANGLTFNQVEFSNANTGTGFESDNHSVATGVTGPPVGDVIVQDVPLTAAAQTPEPATFGLVGLGAIFLTSAVRGRRRS